MNPTHFPPARTTVLRSEPLPSPPGPPMDSGEDRTPFFDDEDDEPLNDDVLIDDEDDDVNVYDEDDSTSSSDLATTNPFHRPPSATTSSAAQVTVAFPSLPVPDLKRQRNEGAAGSATAALITPEKKPLAVLDDSRKLFQRLWNDEDEIELLQGFLEYTTQRGMNGLSSHHHDTTAFYEQIRSKLQLDFNKNQLVEKLRRLKKKYRNVMSKIGSGKDFAFKSAHDQATFEISMKIWGTGVVSAVRGGPASAGVTAAVANVERFDDEDPNPNLISGPNLTNCNPNPNGFEIKTPKSRKRSQSGIQMEQNSGFTQQHVQQPVGVKVITPTVTPVEAEQPLTATTATPIPNTIEDTVRSCLSPIFKELLHNAMNSKSSRGFDFGAALSPMPLGFGGRGGGSIGGEMVTDEKWRKQQILELEVYSKRLELVQEQIKTRLEELRSMGS